MLPEGSLSSILAKQVTVSNANQVTIKSLYACETYFIRVQVKSPHYSATSDLIMHRTAPSKHSFYLKSIN